MTLVIATIVDDAAIIVADGRTLHHFRPDLPPNDETRKIETIGTRFAVAHLGVTELSSVASRMLRNVRDLEALSGEDVAHWLNVCVDGAWASAQIQFDETIDRSSYPLLRVSLIAAGVAAGSPYIAGRLAGEDMPGDSQFLSASFSMMVAGAGEETQAWAQVAYSETLGGILHWIEARGKTPTGPKVHKEVVSAAAAVIREASLRDHTIGGRIHYATVTADGIDGGLVVGPQRK